MTVQVLVVDGDRGAAARAERMLIDRGYGSRVAPTGAEALRIVALERPDLVLLDLGTNEPDGLLVARAIRASPELRSTQIVAMAAPDDRERAREAGFEGLIDKPIDPDVLLSELDGLLGVSGHMLPDAQTTVPSAAQRAAASRLEIRTEFARGDGRLTLVGELDASTEPVLALWVRASLDTHPQRLFLDLREASVDSSGLRSLRALQAAAAAEGCQLVITHASETNA